MNLLYELSISTLNEDILDAKSYLTLSLCLVGYRSRFSVPIDCYGQCEK
ncbi:MAG: hypothetical protein ACTHJ7_11275 [Candidatus Nitrosocosmicus sp.]